MEARFPTEHCVARGRALLVVSGLRVAAIAIAVLLIGAACSSPRAEGPVTRHLATQQWEAGDQLLQLAADVEPLSDGQLWIRDLWPTPRSEIWIPAVGVALWSGAMDEDRAWEEFERAVQSLDTNGRGGALPATIALIAGGGDLESLAPVLLSVLPPEVAATFSPRLEAMSLPPASRPTADCAEAERALRDPSLEFSVTATFILSDASGACHDRGPAMVRLFCESPSDWALADRVLDLVALLPGELGALASCAEKHVQTLLPTLGSDPETELQLWGPLFWLAVAAPDLPIPTSNPLVEEALRVVADDGRTQFPPENPSLSEEYQLAVWIFLALGLLSPQVLEAAEREVERHGDRWAARSPCPDAGDQELRLLPSEASNAPTATIDLLVERLDRCAVPIVARPADPLAALFVDRAASIAGCLNAGRPGTVRPELEPAPPPEGFEGDRTVALLLALGSVPGDVLCKSLRSVNHEETD